MANEITEYVVGFLFDEMYGRDVALIQKNRPAWQAGSLNGIGGHIEDGESADEAMVREFFEETGARVTDWTKFVVMDFPGARITFFKTTASYEVLNTLQTMTDEPVGVYRLADLMMGRHRIIPNLMWLLPLAAYTADSYKPISVVASMSEVVGPRGMAG